MKNFLNPHIKKIKAYLPGFQPQNSNVAIKLNTNESPYPAPEKILEHIRSLQTNDLKKYPDPLSQSLRKKIAQRHGFDKDWIIIGNGSDEILKMIFQTCTTAQNEILYPTPTYSLYETLANIHMTKITTIPFDNNQYLNLNAIAQSKARIFFLANPNSPTGHFLDPSFVEKIGECFSGLLVIDEAYVDFACKNSLPLVKKYKNIFVVRTFSKAYSLAGIRLGWGVAHPEIIREILKVKDSYNINTITQKIGESILDLEEPIKESIEKIKKTRDIFSDYLSKQNWMVSPSQANFIWTKPPYPAEKLYNYLTNQNIFLRYFKEYPKHLRITIGNDKEMLCLQKHIDIYKNSLKIK